ncbi:MAG: HNH endonuclease [Deltaproteobacteria bacterium]|nr:MAG: HNH endonuclease [Deltaproteobacteria bacterium]
MIYSKVLVLNRFYFPVHITSVKRAFSMLYQGVVRAIDENYRMFDFQSWSELSVSVEDDALRTVDRLIRVPRVVVLVAYDRMPRRHVRFSRMNIYARDRNTCQYCGKTFPRTELNLDHVLPRSQGGKSTWENVVCSCIECNRKKGGRTPEQAGMRLIRSPTRPSFTPLAVLHRQGVAYREWMSFLNFVDASYWCTELET